MTAFADSLRHWLCDAALPRAQHPQRAQRPEDPGSARSALFARSVHERDPFSLPPEWGMWNEDARFVFLERMAVAEDLGMSLRRGDPAWNIAVGEAAMTGECADPRARADWLAGVASSILGVPVRAEVIPTGHRFPGEPDWNANPLGRPGPGGPSGTCHTCRGSSWWRPMGQRGRATCGRCHPPAPGLVVEWLPAPENSEVDQ